MKKRILIFIIIGALLLLFLANCSMKNILLNTYFYQNNDSLNRETNKEIKSLLLNVMKYRHSTIVSIDENELYTEELIIQLQKDTSSIEKSFWVNINYDFMNSVEKKNESEYTAKIQMKSPDDWCYYFKIKFVDGQYIVSDFEIDP